MRIRSVLGIPVLRHGGDMIGYHSDVFWFPEQKVGAVILTNGDQGATLRGPFRRKLLTVPADATTSEKLATNYSNDALGTTA